MKFGDQKELERLLKAGVDLFSTYGKGGSEEDENGLCRGTSPILHAARCGRRDMFDAILHAIQVLR